MADRVHRAANGSTRHAEGVHARGHDLPHGWGATAPRPVQGLGRPLGVPGRSTATETPISMAMHLHATFSEQTASYEAHLAEARRLGVDVLWWTDHDFRVNAHGYREAVGFDGMTEPGPEPVMGWEWVEEREGDFTTAEASFVEDPHSPDEPGRALRIEGRAATRRPATVWLHGKAANLRYQTCLADTTVELDVWPNALTDGGALVVEIQSSFHPAHGSRPAGRYVVRYEISEPEADPTGAAGPATRRRLEGDGLSGVVELTAARHQWRRLAMRPVDDIAALWPDLHAADNSLVHLRLGVRSTGSPSDVVVDRLRFLRSERDDSASLDLRRRIFEAYAEEFSDIRQYDSLEISLSRHVNWFGGDLAMPIYPDGLRHRNFDPAFAEQAAALIHAHGGLASWNHPLGTMYGPETKEELAEILLRTDALGCDVMEIGNNPDLDDMAWVFDVACRNGVFVTGSGVSDDHTAEDWLGQRHNYLTHVWSPTVELSDVFAALRGGRAWFAKAEWRGNFSIEAGGTPAMGAALSTDNTVPVAIRATDLPADTTLEVITGAVDPGGRHPLTPAVETCTVPAARLTARGHELDLRPGSYVRAQVRAADGEIIAASNPVWALPERSTVRVPEARQLALS